MYSCMVLFFSWCFSVSDAFLLSGPSYHSTPIPQNGGGITAPEGSVMHILLQDVALLKQELATALNQITFLQAELKEQRKLYKGDIEILRHDVKNLQRFTKYSPKHARHNRKHIHSEQNCGTKCCGY